MAQAEKVYSRSTATRQISMWGTLHVNRADGKLAGWLVDSWTESGTEPHYRPRMNWVSQEDGKFYRVHMVVGPPRNSITIEEEDTGIEPERLTLISSILASWDEDWINLQRLA
jgi:hypothetical protein